MERTEAQKIAQEGIKITIAGKEFYLRPLTMRKAMLWRQGLGAAVLKMLQPEEAFTDSQSFKQALVDAPLEMADAVISYLKIANEVPQAEIDELLDSADEQEIYNTFSVLMRLGMNPMISQRSIQRVLAKRLPEDEKELDQVYQKQLSAARSTLQ